MKEVPSQDVIVYRVGEEIVCDNCVKIEELLKLKEQDIIILSEREKGLYFCVRCKKQIL